MALTLGLMLIAGIVMAASGFESSAMATYYIEQFTRAYKIKKEQADSIRAIVAAWDQYGDGDGRKLAYILALAWHECRLKPIREIRAKQGTDVYNIQNRYWSTGYFGRGFVQITWEKNYAKFTKIVGVDLVRNPDAALRPDIAAKIIVIGMMEGLFTGRKLSDYINESNADYYNARRTVGAINVAGTDTAQLIVNHLNAIK